MKSKYWLLILLALLAICAGLSLWLLLPGPAATQVQILSEGKVVETLDLRQDRQYTVTTDLGSNTVTVRDGKIAVTAADCPDHHCMARGWCSSGPQIVCLPHRLQIRFLGPQPLDGVSG